MCPLPSSGDRLGGRRAGATPPADLPSRADPHRVVFSSLPPDSRIRRDGGPGFWRRHGVNRLPARVGRRAVYTHRYAKQVPGHHVQVDVTFLTLRQPNGRTRRRYQYTAIDDATRIRALRVYPRHTQQNAIAFLEHVIATCPFRIHTVRTDRGHEFQAQFHRHLADQGIQHVYIKPRTPRLNGKVERSHRTDKEEFYQLLTYTGDVDLRKRLAAWETFYNYHRPHGAFAGKTPYERCVNGYSNEAGCPTRSLHHRESFSETFARRKGP